MNIAVILCSGQGRRMGAKKNKVLLQLQRKPLVFHAINSFEKSPKIDQIILVCHKNETKLFESMIKKCGFKKTTNVIVGGKERQDSGRNAIKFLSDSLQKKDLRNSIVLFHNGANPFVSQNEISESIKTAKKSGACAVAHPTKDTIKETNKNNIVKKTLDRSSLWNMQTPQTIKFPLAKEAFEKAKNENFCGTDDVSLVEKLGKKVKIIQASKNNFKITTPLDLELAKIIIKKNV